MGIELSIYNTEKKKKYHLDNISKGVAKRSADSPIIDGLRTAKPMLYKKIIRSCGFSILIMVHPSSQFCYYIYIYQIE
jgi:hypothetical protein